MKTEKYQVIGVMSGTSLDGIDLCEVEFKLNNNTWSFDIIKTKTEAYAKKWVDILKNAHLLALNELESIDKDYTLYLSKVIREFIDKPEDIDLVCSHGHTVWHQPDKGITYQIGNRPELAKLINRPVVCDFRKADVKLDGQGAPLVPVGDRLLFSEFDYCLNIGGFVNVSYEKQSSRMAFDVCPANKILNYYAAKLGFAYDDKGKIASGGDFQINLFDKLNGLKFYNKSSPKSLGIEWLEDEFLPVVESFDISIEDKLHTICHHIAFQISKILKEKTLKVFITGGGAYHDYLINCIKDYSASAIVIIPEAQIIEYKEALIFGLLGILRYRDEINVLSSVTGAKYDHSSGVVFLP
jgi:anhydro-N-acetylmuramic acid kinase